MILVVNICKERLHYFEFVKPVCDILKKDKINYLIRDYKVVTKKDLCNCERVIICGTSLLDNDFIKNINQLRWLTNFDKPVLGICGGMQIIGILFKGKLKKKIEIGYYKENFNKEFLRLNGKCEVYHLHNNFIDFCKLKDFDVFSGKEVPQAVKHREKSVYGVLFHPEVRQKGLIEEFCSI